MAYVPRCVSNAPIEPWLRDALPLQGEVKMHCKHAYTEHIRGRMLHFKVSFDAGNGRSRRTIGQAALPLMSVLPKREETPVGWPQGHHRQEWPFSVPLYHGYAINALFINSVSMPCAGSVAHLLNLPLERSTYTLQIACKLYRQALVYRFPVVALCACGPRTFKLQIQHFSCGTCHKDLSRQVLVNKLVPFGVLVL
jgi:hypothetical protein